MSIIGHFLWTDCSLNKSEATNGCKLHVFEILMPSRFAAAQFLASLRPAGISAIRHNCTGSCTSKPGPNAPHNACGSFPCWLCDRNCKSPIFPIAMLPVARSTWRVLAKHLWHARRAMWFWLRTTKCHDVGDHRNTPNLWNENLKSTANRRENVCLVSLAPGNAGRLQQVRRANWERRGYWSRLQKYQHVGVCSRSLGKTEDFLWIEM